MKSDIAIDKSMEANDCSSPQGRGYQGATARDLSQRISEEEHGLDPQAAVGGAMGRDCSNRVKTAEVVSGVKDAAGRLDQQLPKSSSKDVAKTLADIGGEFKHTGAAAAAAASAVSAVFTSSPDSAASKTIVNVFEKGGDSKEKKKNSDSSGGAGGNGGNGGSGGKGGDGGGGDMITVVNPPPTVIPASPVGVNIVSPPAPPPAPAPVETREEGTNWLAWEWLLLVLAFGLALCLCGLLACSLFGCIGVWAWPPVSAGVVATGAGAEQGPSKSKGIAASFISGDSYVPGALSASLRNPGDMRNLHGQQSEDVPLAFLHGDQGQGGGGTGRRTQSSIIKPRLDPGMSR